LADQNPPFLFAPIHTANHLPSNAVGEAHPTHSTRIKREVREMSNMSKLASGAAYGASAGTVANGVLTRLSPDEWSAIGVIAGIVVALLTFGINKFTGDIGPVSQVVQSVAFLYQPCAKIRCETSL